MLAEIIIYIGLFSVLFSSAFSAAFQTVDALRYLQNGKNTVDELYFMSSRLDGYIQAEADWSKISEEGITDIISDEGLQIKFISFQLLETPTSTDRVLLLSLEVNKKVYEFSYVQNK
ncbi:TPA: hypothetical protein DCQ44_00960 [Candidatus Taylorbacteria bacterium]|nr:hypothetical protein [Candidatus Taylorbacteria bacterium]